MTTGKTIALTRQTFVGKVTSLLCKMLSRLVILFFQEESIFYFQGCSHHLQWFWSPKKIVWHCFHCLPIYLPWSDGTGCHDLHFLNAVLSHLFHSLLSLSSRGSLVFCFLPQGWCHLHIWGYWYFSQQSWFQLVLHPAQPFTQCTLHISLISRVTIYSLMHSFPNFEPVCCSMFSSNCCFLTCTQISQEADQVVWYSHLFQNFPQFIVIHTVKGFGIVKKAEVDIFGNSLAFSMIQRMLAIWSLVPLPFLHPAWTSGSSQFTCYWSLARRILSITLLAYEMSAIVW